MTGPAYIGLDLGTSSLKGVALDGFGALVASERESYDTARPAAGRAEQDPGDWIAAARRSALAARRRRAARLRGEASGSRG